MRKDERGVAMPTPVVLLSVVAVALAVVAFLFTGHDKPAEKDITPVSKPSPSVSATPTASPTPTPPPKPKPKPVDRGKVKVFVFNNTNIRGLASTVSDKAAGIGWHVVGSDNWMGTVPANTVYYPPQLKRAGQQLALDLGIKRTHPAI
ncbi:MAG: LytR C-terminal domain-containing protein, partial [Nocardioides sp.]|nr:LytR C-terminal domain-containing protein [Nocardioides sp.]